MVMRDGRIAAFDTWPVLQQRLSDLPELARADEAEAHLDDATYTEEVAHTQVALAQTDAQTLRAAATPPAASVTPGSLAAAVAVGGAQTDAGHAARCAAPSVSDGTVTGHAVNSSPARLDVDVHAQSDARAGAEWLGLPPASASESALPVGVLGTLATGIEASTVAESAREEHSQRSTDVHAGSVHAADAHAADVRAADVRAVDVCAADVRAEDVRSLRVSFGVDAARTSRTSVGARVSFRGNAASSRSIDTGEVEYGTGAAEREAIAWGTGDAPLPLEAARDLDNADLENADLDLENAEICGSGGGSAGGRAASPGGLVAAGDVPCRAGVAVAGGKAESKAGSAAEPAVESIVMKKCVFCLFSPSLRLGQLRVLMLLQQRSRDEINDKDCVHVGLAHQNAVMHGA